MGRRRLLLYMRWMMVHRWRLWTRQSPSPRRDLKTLFTEQSVNAHTPLTFDLEHNYALEFICVSNLTFQLSSSASSAQ